MNIALITWDEAGQALYKFLSTYGRQVYHVSYVVENNSRLWGEITELSGSLRALSSGSAAALYKSGVIEKFLMPSLDESTNERIVKMLSIYDIPADDILYAPVEVIKGDIAPENRLWHICPYQERRELETIEIHAADHCNLNCKNCSMFCGLVPRPLFPEYQQVISDIRQLKRYFDHIKVFRLIGGEPLLNPELEKYILEVRSVFPYTDIRLITNGLLVRNMSQRLINAIRENDVTFIVTHYLPVSEQMESIHEFLSEKKIRHTIPGIITEFQKIYDVSGTSNPVTRFASCHWKSSCATMGAGKIAACFVPFVIRYLSDAFELGISEDGLIDLYEEGLTTKKIRERMQNPFNLCKYCAPKGIVAPWEAYRKTEGLNICDWSIEN